MAEAMRHLPVLLPAVIENGAGDLPGPQEVIRRVLASHPQAAGLLSEARHCETVARTSAAQAVRRARLSRDCELACELARRQWDPRRVRTIRWVPAAMAVLALLGVCAGTALSLVWGLPWLDRMVLTGAAVAAAGLLGWAGSGRWDRGTLPGRLAALALVCLLVAVSILTARRATVIAVSQALSLALALAAAGLAMFRLTGHAENSQCWRLRRAARRAAKGRGGAELRACRDRDAAVAAVAAWESLIAEECRLGYPARATGQWAQACAALAREAATPA